MAIFSNKELRPVFRESIGFPEPGIVIGGRSMGCRNYSEVFLPIPKELEILEANKQDSEFSIGFDENERPCIVPGHDGFVYLILTTDGDMKGFSDGSIHVGIGIADARGHIENYYGHPKLIAESHGQYYGGDRYPARWQTLLIRAREGDIFNLHWTGADMTVPDTIYAVLDGRVVVTNLKNVVAEYERAGKELPITIIPTRYGIPIPSFRSIEWHPF